MSAEAQSLGVDSGGADDYSSEPSAAEQGGTALEIHDSIYGEIKNSGCTDDFCSK
jgi:hypothetical protein